MPKTFKRRQFLKSATVAGAASFSSPNFLAAAVLGRDGNSSPNNQVTLGVIGMGRRCTYDLKAILELEDVKCVAIADVQQSRRNDGKKLVDEKYSNDQCKLYRDFRRLLDRQDIDAVLIATGARSGGYPCFRRIFRTMILSLARALSFRCQSTVTLFWSCSTRIFAILRSSSLPRASTALWFCERAS